MPGTLFVVATPIGNLDDITLRALRVLRDAAVIAAEDTRRTAHLLARHGIATPTTSLHEHNEDRKAEAILARLLAGEDVALVSDAGTPTISDPGSRLVRRAVAAGIRIEPIPGANAAVATLSASGLMTDSFGFYGFPPTRSKDREAWFQRLRIVGGTAVFYEAPHRIRQTLSELRACVGDRPVVVGRELTKIHEELVRGPISEVLDRLSNERGEFTVVVDAGPAAQQFGETTEISPNTKRELVAEFATKLGLTANDVYKAIEGLKNRS
jgi:16S rRNA (cytidine1402-2'-O)-methyltransferase